MRLVVQKMDAWIDRFLLKSVTLFLYYDYYFSVKTRILPELSQTKFSKQNDILLRYDEEKGDIFKTEAQYYEKS